MEDSDSLLVARASEGWLGKDGGGGVLQLVQHVERAVAHLSLQREAGSLICLFCTSHTFARASLYQPLSEAVLLRIVGIPKLLKLTFECLRSASPPWQRLPCMQDLAWILQQCTCCRASAVVCCRICWSEVHCLGMGLQARETRGPEFFYLPSQPAIRFSSVFDV